MIATEVAELAAGQADRYWSLANALTGFYFAQALLFWYKLGDGKLAEQLRRHLRMVLALLWLQGLAVSGLVYLCYWAEYNLLHGVGGAILMTSGGACYVRLAIIAAITALSTLIILLATGHLQRRQPLA